MENGDVKYLKVVMNNRELMIEVCRFQDNILSENVNGVFTNLMDGKVIPYSQIKKHKYPHEDGLYIIFPATCGGENGCFIGKPKLDCSGYDGGNHECGKYIVRSFFNYEEDVCKLMEFVKRMNKGCYEKR